MTLSSQGLGRSRMITERTMKPMVGFIEEGERAGKSTLGPPRLAGLLLTIDRVETTPQPLIAVQP